MILLQERSAQPGLLFTVVSRLRDYSMMLKPNLSTMVVFSSVVGYLLAPGISFQLWPVLALFVGGMLVTGASNTLNQVLERDIDGLMHRTRNRPLPTGRVGVSEGVLVACVAAVAGTLLISLQFNWLAGLLSFISLLLYAFAYTPMKRVHPISVLIGAIPGAMPPLIGWAAATGTLSSGGWALFAIQFFWQFPHYWAIAWVCCEDYARAGLRMLPSHSGKTRFTGLQCIFYALVLIPLSLVPQALGIAGLVATCLLLLAAAAYVGASVIFYLKNDRASARLVMFASFIYLPVVLLAMLLNKA